MQSLPFPHLRDKRMGGRESTQLVDPSNAGGSLVSSLSVHLLLCNSLLKLFAYLSSHAVDTSARERSPIHYFLQDLEYRDNNASGQFDGFQDADPRPRIGKNGVQRKKKILKPKHLPLPKFTRILVRVSKL